MNSDKKQEEKTCKKIDKEKIDAAKTAKMKVLKNNQIIRK